MRTALIVAALLLAPALAGAEEFGPWSTAAAPVLAQGRPGVVPLATPPRASTLQTSGFWLSFRFYQAVLSPIDGPRCAHRPTCSLYAIQAMRSHALVGPFLAIDRLWRGAESSSIRTLPVLFDEEGGLHFRDPLEESDFWFR